MVFVAQGNSHLAEVQVLWLKLIKVILQVIRLRNVQEPFAMNLVITFLCATPIGRPEANQPQ